MDGIFDDERGASPVQQMFDADEKDRFGLPTCPCLLESDESWQARIGATQDLVQEAVTAVVRQLGRKEARRLFLAALKEPAKGRRPDKKRDEAFCAAHDQEVKSGTRSQFAAKRAAEKLATGKDDDVESLAKGIRKAVRDRDKRWGQYRANRKLLGPSLIDETDG